MKLFIGKILATLLDKMGFTVIIGCKTSGEVTMLRNNQFYYSNDLSDTRLFYENGQQFNLPDGKFTVKSSLDNKTNEYKNWYTKVINKNNK